MQKGLGVRTRFLACHGLETRIWTRFGPKVQQTLMNNPGQKRTIAPLCSILGNRLEAKIKTPVLFGNYLILKDGSSLLSEI